MRAGRMTIVESYITFKNGEAFLFGAQVQPLLSASTHVVPEATRTRKLLLNRREIEKLQGAINQKGYSCVPLACYWKGPHAKLEIALVKGNSFTTSVQRKKTVIGSAIKPVFFINKFNKKPPFWRFFI
jgi:tmRNA-binding protein